MSQITTRDIAVDNGKYVFNTSTSGSKEKPAVLLLHGSGPGATALTNWEAILEDLATDFYNIAPDIIGFGDSSHPEPPPAGLRAFTDLRVETLAALLDEMGLDQVDLVGNSMGGIISICFALTHPDRVRRIVLMGAGGAPGVQLTEELLSLMFFYENPTVEAMAELMQKFVVDTNFFGDKLQDIAAERMPRAMRPEVERSHRATFTMDQPLPINAESISTIRQPVLVIQGDQDRLIPGEVAEWYHEHLSDSRLEIVDKAGHWLQIEHHDTFVRLVREFLA